MIDFTGVKTLTIPEGVVVKIIKKASGAVVWERVSAGGLPSGYTQVEYIQSSGTQYIDTGFIPNQDTRVIVDCKVDFINSSTNDSFVFGVRNTAQSNAFVCVIQSNRLFQNYGNNYVFTNCSFAYERMTIDFNKNNAIFTGSQSVSSSLSYIMFTCPSSLIICSAYSPTEAILGNTSRSFCGKIYSCKIYDNDVLVRNFVPCTNSSGAAGLYDTVNDVFYGNSGSGTFIYG